MAANQIQRCFPVIAIVKAAEHIITPRGAANLFAGDESFASVFVFGYESWQDVSGKIRRQRALAENQLIAAAFFRQSCNYARAV